MDQTSPTQPEKGLDVALAEYNALRAEIVARITAVHAIVGLGLTAVGIVAGIALAKDGHRSLLLVLPVVALLVNLLCTAENRAIIGAATFIRVDLWPHLTNYVGETPCWETFVHERRAARLGPRNALATETVTVLVFSGTAIVALVVAGDQATGIEIAGLIVLTAIAIGVPVWSALSYRPWRKKPVDAGVSRGINAR
jgi:hypothetical protein